MYVKFDALNRLEVPKLTICNPGSTYSGGKLSRVVGILSATDSEELVLNFNSTSELNFRAPKMSDENPEVSSHLMKMYKALQNRRLIFVDGIGYFVITKVEDSYADGVQAKLITATSCEVEIMNKQLTYIEDGTYGFMDLLEQIVSTLPLWTINYVDPAVADKYRTFEDVSIESNTLAFMQEDMQDAYECIFVFDCINRYINVYDQNNYIRETNIHLTKDDLITGIDITENSEELYTAISVFGVDDLTINAVNPLGTNVIYDFTYYLDWMTETLREKVEAWMRLMDTSTESYYNQNLRYYNMMTEQFNLQSDIDKLNQQLTMYQRCRENIVAEGNDDSVGEYNDIIESYGGTPIGVADELSSTVYAIDKLMEAARSERENKQARLGQITAEMEVVKNSISEIQQNCSILNYFTEDEYNELYNFIYEGSYEDEYVSITESMDYAKRFQQMKLLYDRGVSQLERVSRPTQEFSIDVENFIFEKEFEQWSEQLETGCLINVDADYDETILLFLSSFTVNYDDHDLSMTFGNRFNRFDPKSVFNKALGNIQKTANTLNYIKEVVYPIKSGEFNVMKEALENSRTLTKNAALSSVNQEVIIDDTGYTGRAILENGEYDPQQIKITGKNIVFTDDAWDTARTAIGEIVMSDGTVTYGINAETVIGDVIIGNQLNIYDSNGTPLLEAVDDKISLSVGGLSDKIDSAEQTVNSVVQSVHAEYYRSTSETDLIGGEWNVIVPEYLEGYYYWQRIVYTLVDGSVTTGDPVCITGAKGVDGSDGVSTYFYVRYSENETGTPMTTVPTDTTMYIGVCSTTKPTAPTSNLDYDWTLIKGSDGVPGDPGENGKTQYLHIKYSDDGETFTSNDGEDLGAWIGTLVDFNETDSTIFSEYTWKKFTEDVDEELEEIRSSITEQCANVSVDCERIILSALESYVETGDYGKFKEEIETTLSVMSNEILMNFNTTQEQISTLTSVDTDTNSKFTELYRYISFANGNITLGASDSQITLTIENDNIVFRKNGVEFGSWDGDNFYTGNIIIRLGDRFRYGSFEDIPREDGSVITVWVGD